jgi:hypothetical protein
VGGPPAGGPPPGGPPVAGIGVRKLLLMIVFIRVAIEWEVPGEALGPAAGGVTGDGGRCIAAACVAPIDVVIIVAIVAIVSD